MANEKLTWVLELQAKLDGATKINRALGDVERKLVGVSAKMKAFEGAGSAAGGALKMIGSFVAGNLITAGIGAVAGAIHDIAVEGMESAGEIKRMSRAYDFFLDKATKKGEFEWLEKLADILPGTDDDLKSLGITMFQLGIPLEKVNDSILAAKDIEVMSGGKISAENAASALESIYQTGTITTKMLRGLGLTGDAAFEALAKSTGKSVKEVKNLAGEGKIDKLRALESVFAAIDKQAGGLGTAGAMGGSDLGERIKDLKDEVVDSFAHAFLEVEPAIADLVHGITKKFRDADFVSSIKTIVQDVTHMVTSIDWKSGVDYLRKGLQWVANLFGEIKQKWDEFHGTRDASTVAGKLTSAAGSAYRWSDAGGVFKPGGIYDSAVSGVEKAIGFAHRTGAKIGGAIEQGAKDILEVNSPSRKFEKIGRYAAEGYAKGMSGQAGQIEGATSDAISIPSPSSFQRASSASQSFEVPVSVVVNVNGGATGVGDEIAAKLQGMLPGMLQGAMQRLAIEAGV